MQSLDPKSDRSIPLPVNSLERRLLNFFALLFLTATAEFTGMIIGVVIETSMKSNDKSFVQMLTLKKRVHPSSPNYGTNLTLVFTLLIPVIFAALMGGLTGEPFKGNEPYRVRRFLRSCAARNHSSDSSPLLFPVDTEETTGSKVKEASHPSLASGRRRKHGHTQN